jgi:hypothetical protein
MTMLNTCYTLLLDSEGIFEALTSTTVPTAPHTVHQSINQSID